MTILRSIEGLAGLPGPVVLAAGTFDGLHLGHQALIRHAMGEAAAIGGTPVVLTFDRHPAALVRPERSPKLLSTFSKKMDLLLGMGVPAVLLLEFNAAIASISAEEFIRSLAISARPLAMICVGSQWSFGRGAAGNVALLRELGNGLGFSVSDIDSVQVGGFPVSSTRIRDAVACGDFSSASACLGRPFQLSGTVVNGAGLGAKIGFPTANIDVNGMQLPPDGVYAVKICHAGKNLYGACNIGVRPTVALMIPHRTVEVHLFDFIGDLVGEELALEFVKFLRPERQFAGLEELKARIASDCAEAKTILGI